MCSCRFDERFVECAVWKEKSEGLLQKVEEKVIFEILSDKGYDEFDNLHWVLGLHLIQQVSISGYAFNSSINSL